MPCQPEHAFPLTSVLKCASRATVAVLPCCKACSRVGLLCDHASIGCCAAAVLERLLSAPPSSPPWPQVWTVRSLDLVPEFTPLLWRLLAAPATAVRIHVTDSSALEEQRNLLPRWLPGCLHEGRPDVAHFMRQWQAGPEELVHVHSCGPAELEKAVASACDGRWRAGGRVHLTRMSFEM